MLEHQKFVLKSVSDQEHLFHRELLKSIEWLGQEDQYELFYWLKSYNYFSHKDIIKQAFAHLFIKEEV